MNMAEALSNKTFTRRELQITDLSRYFFERSTTVDV